MPQVRTSRVLVMSGILGLMLSGCGGETSSTPDGSANIDAGTGAWNGAAFRMDKAGVVGRSNIVLGRPNLLNTQAMPLGNGRLGVAVWSANGLTAQLNRSDTLPKRLSPGQVVIPGLAAIANAPDYRGVLDLYNGEFRESGGGMTATAYVQPDTDTLVIDVTGADPAKPQTATLNLWSPRTPTASIVGNAIGVLSQAWTDGKPGDADGSSGQAFGSLAAITAVAKNVAASVGPDSLSTTLTFTPNADGTFHIIVGAPHYDGSQAVPALAVASVANAAPTRHAQSWNAFWEKAGLIKLTSSDGSGEYMENLRNIYLYSAQAENQDTYPGSQAGVADLFSWVGDAHRWDPAAYWHWNLRMQFVANLSAGLPDLNAPYFNLYSGNLSSIEAWTHANIGGDGASVCVPETMRFNGNGKQINSAGVLVSNCSASAPANYNARTLSTGAEVSHFIWSQYLATRDLNFLERNYPFMVAAARFMLGYQRAGADKLLHTSPTNAHETQWDVTDSTTDLAAIRTLYADTLHASQTLKHAGRSVDSNLVSALDGALPLTPDYPRTQSSGSLTLLPASADADGTDVIADSYFPAAANQNSENIGLEPLWPFEQIGDTSPLYALAQRTFASRPYKATNDWSFDPIDAARLKLGDEVKHSLVTLTQAYQKYPSGFAQFATGGEPYVEQIGVVAAALAESLVQDYDGVIRIAPAVPGGWDYDGTVFVRGNTKVDVQVRNGIPTTVVIEPGSNAALTVRNPWPGSTVTALSAGHSLPVTTQGANLVLQPAGTHAIVLRSPAAGNMPAEPVSGAVATVAKHLGAVQIGL
ncbi:hypothetical protein FEQ05_02223 [Burkholderia pseudomultivorans]|uniref:Glycosyl hydrolase family 95 catalytic domain-containing protein n=2 Tax=Burkholderia pseudomultivorans TaxID=1207504 RepID=A0ABU2E428_9BURK|nr:hypothetical protein [Burkholderia pseudomultivorans]MDR8737136.1 hypothetical protein [Burkholderia pseudomultivorans]MDR8740309.1 hypothetical protein [Burkholderia pseudomultivorans]MDR8754607.1 hypothetical protein [Burkholderia pseudomultivorans]MDR8776723.1 hypothetical protein [Burkholderia pseudomultivorans]